MHSTARCSLCLLCCCCFGKERRNRSDDIEFISSRPSRGKIHGIIKTASAVVPSTNSNADSNCPRVLISAAGMQMLCRGHAAVGPSHSCKIRAGRCRHAALLVCLESNCAGVVQMQEGSCWTECSSASACTSLRVCARVSAPLTSSSSSRLTSSTPTLPPEKVSHSLSLNPHHHHHHPNKQTFSAPKICHSVWKKP